MTARLQIPRLGASACVFRSGLVLMVQRAKPPLAGSWSLPGGRVELGETTYEAALRELREETGIEAELTRLAGIFDVIRRSRDGAVQSHFAIACHAGRWLSGEARAAGDAAAVRWVKLDEVAALDPAPGVGDAVRIAASLLSI